MFWAYSISGFFVGLLVGLVGVGGGSVMTPLLTLVFNVSPATAVGSDLAYACITKTFGTIAHRKLGNVKWNLVLLLCLGSIPASLLTIAWFKSHSVINDSSIGLIKQMIGITILLTVISLLFREKIVIWLKAHPKAHPKGNTRVVLTLLTGILLGFLVTLTSIGSGAIGATLILMLYPELELPEVAGTDIAYAVPLTAVAGLGHAYLGTVNYTLIAALLVGSIPGVLLGANLSRILPEKFVRYVFSFILSFTAFKLIF